MEKNIVSIAEKGNMAASEMYRPIITGFVFESEDERLERDVRRPDIEKLQLFTKMIRRNIMLKQMTQ